MLLYPHIKEKKKKRLSPTTKTEQRQILLKQTLYPSNQLGIRKEG